MNAPTTTARCLSNNALKQQTPAVTVLYRLVFGLLLSFMGSLPARAQPDNGDPYANMPVPHTYNCYGNVLARSSGPTNNASPAALPPCCGPTATPTNSTYGMAMTPHGQFRLLVIFAGFEEDYTLDPVTSQPLCGDYNDGSWPQDDGINPPGTTLPANLSNFGYTSQAQFSSTATDVTVSNYLYQMSKTSANPFQVTFDYFPHRINVSRTAASPGDIMAYGRAVLNKIDQDYPNYDWSPWDRRKNNPKFQTDNSGFATDNELDYVVICWRTKDCSRNFLPPNTGIAGVPTHTFPATATQPAYKITAGHMQTGLGLDANTFLHEFAHTLYNAPHLWGVNRGTTGPYWSQTFGWGMMPNVQTYFSANAWERWYLGWTELRTGANQVSSDIQDASSLAATSGFFTLRDALTTGDVMRVRLPNTTQYLWLENRLGTNPFDQRLSNTGGDNLPFRPAPTGLVGMVEDMNPSRQNQDRLYALPTNGMRVVSAQGNFDYVRSATASTYNNRLWGNLINNLYGPAGVNSAPVPNPTGNHSQISTMRFDANGNGVINYDPGTGNDDMTVGNETTWDWVERGQMLDGALGPDIGTRQVGFRYGLDTNPMIIPHQRYDANNERLSQIPLSGLSIEVSSYDAGTGALTLYVSYKDTQIRQDTRWTGDLKAYPNAGGNYNGADVYVSSGVTLNLNRSGTAQRAHPGPGGDFVNDTRLTIGSGAKVYIVGSLKMEGSGTTLYVEDKGRVTIESPGLLYAGPGTTISVQYRSDLDDQNQLILKTGSQLIIRSTGQTIPGTQRSAFPVAYPNPAQTGQVTFAWPAGEQPPAPARFRYELQDLQGHAIRRGTCRAEQTELSGVPAGLYLLVTTSPEGERQTKRVEVH